MILYASQRGRSAELSLHLLNGDQNDHVTVHEIRGFVADDLPSALREAYAISRGTRCRQFLFSVSLNPPEYADVPVEDFEAAIEEIERKVGLVGQPRIVVFHEKNGRRHCHAVWSRIDADKLTAVRMSHFKRKLMEVSQLLFLKHGWKLPKGMQKGQKRSPLHLTREEYRQAVRLAEDPQALKAMFKASWERSDSKETFIRALEENGFLLARGDRRGFVAIDVKGGVYSLTRWLDLGTRDLKSRLGAPETLPDIGQANAYLASRMTENLNRFIAEAKTQAAQKRTPLVQELRTTVTGQRLERQSLIDAQQTRWLQETKLRTARLHGGVSGIWQRVTGEYQKIKAINEAEAKAGLARDRKELHGLVRSHLLERQELQKTVLFYREEHRVEVFRLRQEIARYVSTGTEPPQPAAKAAAGKVPLAAQLAQLDAKISLLPADFLRQEIARLSPDAAKVEAAPVFEKLPLADQLAQVETKLALISGDLSQLQAYLENNMLSDEMRARIRRVIEITLETLQLKAIEAKTEDQKAQDKTREYQAKQAEYNEYVRRFAEIQMKVEAEIRRQEANRAFLEIVNNMSYSLNGVPRWPITVMMPPPEKRLDEREYLQKVVLQRDNAQLVNRVFNSAENESLVSRRPPIDPKTAVPALRQNVLEVKEMLGRAGIRPPSGGGSSTMAPVTIRMTAAPPLRAASKFNAKR
jgi:hypothetical protein